MSTSQKEAGFFRHFFNPYYANKKNNCVKISNFPLGTQNC